MFTELLRLLFVALTAPLWLPVAKALWRELNDLFEEDGGLFGETPGPLQRERLRAERARRPSPMVHEWLAHVRAGAAPAQDGRGGGEQRAPGASAAPPRSSFR